MRRLTRRSLLAQAGAAGAAVAATSLPATLLRAADAAAAAPSPWPLGWMNELAGSMRGAVLTPADYRYLASQAIFNSRFDLVFPQAIARPVDAADVQAIMAWASRHDVVIAPRGGGHGYTGNAISDRALVVDLRAIRGTQISADGQLATVGGGSLSIDVITALSARGLAVPTGTCPSVGITGLALGGGIGSLARAHGLTADRIAGLTIVTPDGAVRTVDERNEPDLFWACRGGGGGNFGIVTQLQLRPVPAVIESHVTIYWPLGLADAALDTFLRTAPEAPRELSGDLAFTTDVSHWGKPVIKYTGIYQGSEAAARAAVAPLTAVGGVAVQVVQQTRQQAALADGACTSVAACRPYRFGAPGTLDRSRFFAGSAYLAGPLDAAGRAALLAAAKSGKPLPGSSRTIILAAHGGAVADLAPNATAYPHRDAQVGIQFYAESSGAWEDGDARAWVKRSRLALASSATGGAYANYLDADQTDWATAFYGASLPRLKSVKAQYDPNGRFRPAQGIPLT